jgi:hypothetical protein
MAAHTEDTVARPEAAVRDLGEQPRQQWWKAMAGHLRKIFDVVHGPGRGHTSAHDGGVDSFYQLVFGHDRIVGLTSDDPGHAPINEVGNPELHRFAHEIRPPYSANIHCGSSLPLDWLAHPPPSARRAAAFRSSILM